MPEDTEVQAQAAALMGEKAPRLAFLPGVDVTRFTLHEKENLGVAEKVFKTLKYLRDSFPAEPDEIDHINSAVPERQLKSPQDIFKLFVPKTPDKFEVVKVGYSKPPIASLKIAASEKGSIFRDGEPVWHVMTLDDYNFNEDGILTIARAHIALLKTPSQEGTPEVFFRFSEGKPPADKEQKQTEKGYTLVLNTFGSTGSHKLIFFSKPEAQ